MAAWDGPGGWSCSIETAITSKEHTARIVERDLLLAG